MTWRCECPGCTAGGRKQYDSAAAAGRFAAAFDRGDRGDMGRRAPLLAMFPLRIWHRLKSRRDGRGARADRR